MTADSVPEHRQRQLSGWGRGGQCPLYTFALPHQREKEPQVRAKSLYCLNSCPFACGAKVGQEREKPQSLHGP